MPKFLVRIELHFGHDSKPDYNKLHDILKKVDAFQITKSSVVKTPNGPMMRPLPDAEYHIESSGSMDGVANGVLILADVVNTPKPGHKNTVLVTEIADQYGINL